VLIFRAWRTNPKTGEKEWARPRQEGMGYLDKTQEEEIASAEINKLDQVGSGILPGFNLTNHLINYTEVR